MPGFPTGLESVEGASATVREIRQQPDVWNSVAAIVTARRAELDRFLAPILERPDLRIVLTGAGTSAFVGDIAAPSLSRFLGRRVDALATTDIVSDPRGCFPQDVPTLVVSFARSGNSPESAAATALADELLTDVSHLVLTCDESGLLHRDHVDHPASLVLLMPEDANDAGFAMTSSFTSMLLGLLLVFGEADESAVAALVGAGRYALESTASAARELTTRGHERVVYLGSGALAGLAHESALKMLELTAGRVVALHDSALGFRHGPKSILNDRTLVVVFLSADPYTRAYDLDILAELRGGRHPENVIAISSFAEPGDERTWVVPGLESLDDAIASVALVVVSQLLALGMSLQHGLTPDNPFPTGDVNRVVRGVSIHSLAG